MAKNSFDELRAIYHKKKPEIERTWLRRQQPKTQDEMFSLLVSCILSSVARWSSVKEVMERFGRDRIIFEGNIDEVEPQLKGLRGRYTNRAKLATYIIAARESFPFLYEVVQNIKKNEFGFTAQGVDWRGVRRMGNQLRENIKKLGVSFEGLREVAKGFGGVGDKQASHFLASVGFKDYAILDIHVIERLVKYGVIDQKPRRLSRATYRGIETKMKEFSRAVGIPFHHLDTLFWEQGSGCNDYPPELGIEQIKEAVLQFSPADLASFRVWFNEWDADIWDKQFELDATEGRLDALANEALRDVRRGRCTDR